MSNRDPERPFKDIGERLSLLLRALGMQSSEMADLIGVSSTRWSNWEVGIVQIPPGEVRKLKRVVPGLRQDWIYDGDTEGLSVDLLKLLNAAPPALDCDPSAPTKKRGRPRKTAQV